ncbi:MAG: hypothetical protein FWH26_00430 [Oscillospiraceae bacterium]|nr:hypothetical protein [Oscillospiraceae bacterium]
MKRSNEEITREILRRTGQLDVRDAQRKRRVYATLSAAAALVLVIGFAAAVPLLIPDGLWRETAENQTATMFASGEIGGYILVAVTAFAAGAAITLFCVKKLGKK